MLFTKVVLINLKNISFWAFFSCGDTWDKSVIIWLNILSYGNRRIYFIKLYLCYFIKTVALCY